MDNLKSLINLAKEPIAIYSRPQITMLTALRGIAALAVVFFHTAVMPPLGSLIYSPLLKMFGTGFFGVDFFFILSGYVLIYVYQGVEKWHFSKEYLQFVYYRFARIYPLHLLMLGVFVLISILASQRYDDVQTNWLSLLENIFLVQAWHSSELTWNVPAWSISLELLVYLGFPAWHWFYKQIKDVHPMLIIPFVLSLLCLQKMCFLLILHQNDLFFAHGSKGFLRILFEFPIGICLFILTQKVPMKAILANVLFILIPTGTLISFLTVHNDFIMIFLFVVVIYASVHVDGLIKTVFTSKPFLWLGERSYAIYMGHFFIMSTMQKVFDMLGSQNSLLFYICVLTVTLGFSDLLYRFVEMPARQYLRDHSPFKITPQIATT